VSRLSAFAAPSHGGTFLSAHSNVDPLCVNRHCGDNGWNRFAVGALKPGERAAGWLAAKPPFQEYASEIKRRMCRLFMFWEGIRIHTNSRETLGRLKGPKSLSESKINRMGMGLDRFADDKIGMCANS